MKQFISTTIVAVLIALLFTSCGYRPSSKFARDIVGEKISTRIVVSSADPENSVIIKDAVDSAIVSIFHASLVEKRSSNTHLVINTSTPSYTPIQYDQNGFVIAYRMSLILTIIKYHNGISKTYNSAGTYDFSINPNAVVTDQERFDAIKLSAAKAINSFIAQMSAEGARANRESKE